VFCDGCGLCNCSWFGEKKSFGGKDWWRERTSMVEVRRRLSGRIVIGNKILEETCV
jgi:hypothetical protein